MRPRIRVLVVEDQACALEGIRLELRRASDFKCVGAFLDFETAKEAIRDKQPDVVLLDLGLPGMDGIEAITMIRENWPRIKVLVFTGSDRDETIYSAFMAGANGFLLKSAPHSELIDSIEKVHAGGAPMSPVVAAAIVEFIQGGQRLKQNIIPHLSPTERTILTEYDRGTPQKQIAANLGISEQTLFTHRNRILEKFGVNSLIRAAYLLRHVTRAS